MHIYMYTYIYINIRMTLKNFSSGKRYGVGGLPPDAGPSSAARRAAIMTVLYGLVGRCRLW